MEKGPLAKYRKGGTIPPLENELATAEPLPQDDKYLAFYPVDREPRCLEVRASGAAWLHPSYSFYQYVAEDAGRGRRFDIVYGFMVVSVKGRNLHAVVQSITRHSCAWIQQYDASRWERPEPSAPIIEGITFHHGIEKRGEMLSAKSTQPEEA